MPRTRVVSPGVPTTPPVHARQSRPEDAALLPPHWIVWRDTAHDGATNMATDLALLDAASAACAVPDAPPTLVWRWYTWEAPTISFGRHEAVRGRYDAESVAAAGLAAVRRPTGGRALLHGREITYSATMPLAPAVSWRTAYAALNAILLRTLRRLGIDAMVAGATAPVRPEGPVCFEAPAEGEIVVAGRKLVGSAVWRQAGAYLQHGSILMHDDQARLIEACRQPMPPVPPAAELARLAPHVALPQLDGALHAVLEAQGHVVTPVPLAPSTEVRDAIASHRRHFVDPDWLWRR